MDYLGKDHIEEGMALAKKAVALSQKLGNPAAGKRGAHMIKALALTYEGFFYKSLGQHQDAVTNNIAALDIRTQLYGEPV